MATMNRNPYEAMSNDDCALLLQLKRRVALRQSGNMPAVSQLQPLTASQEAQLIEIIEELTGYHIRPS